MYITKPRHLAKLYKYYGSLKNLDLEADKPECQLKLLLCRLQWRELYMATVSLRHALFVLTPPPKPEITTT